MTDSFGARKTLGVRSANYQIYRLDAVKGAVDSLPYTLKILLENMLRFEDGANITAADITALANWDPKAEPDREISFTPARVVLQDFTGVPAVVDLAAMRDAVVKLGGKAQRINPLSPAELVIDHSVQVDFFGTPDAIGKNTAISSSATSSATRSCAGARTHSRTSASCRRTPASCTRSTSSI